MTPKDLFQIVSCGNRANVFPCYLNPLGVTVQCRHETGNFRSQSMLTHWNLAGIKCTRGWVSRGGKCFSSRTWEEKAGQRVDLVAGFRSYSGVDEFLRDYAQIIAASYPVSAASPDCVWLFYAGLHGRWATDSSYFRALVALTTHTAPLVGMSMETLRHSHDAALGRGYPFPWMEEVVGQCLGVS